MANVTMTRLIAAPPEVVFDVLTDHQGYVDITPLRAVDMEREGSPHPNGVGAIRSVYVLGRRFPAVREQVDTFTPSSLFEYHIVSGLPAERIQGRVEITPVPHGTRLVYHHEVLPSFRIPSVLVRAGIRTVIGFLIRGVTRESERRALAG